MNTNEMFLQLTLSLDRSRGFLAVFASVPSRNLGNCVWITLGAPLSLARHPFGYAFDYRPWSNMALFHQRVSYSQEPSFDAPAVNYLGPLHI